MFSMKYVLLKLLNEEGTEEAFLKTVKQYFMFKSCFAVINFNDK